MAAELLMGIKLLCSDFPGLNQIACRKSSEAYTIQSGFSTQFDKAKDFVQKNLYKVADERIFAAAGAGARYALTGEFKYKLKLIGNTSFILGKKPNDSNGTFNFNWSF